MRHAFPRLRFIVTVAAVLVSATASGQSRPLATAALADDAAQAAPAVRRLSVDDAVRLAVEQNLGIQIERFNPQIHDLTIAQTRAAWAPTLTSNIANTSTDTAATSVFAGGQNKVTDGRFETSFGVGQLLQTGANYNVSWNNSRSTSTNFFNTFDPQLRSNLSFTFTQPLLRNFKIDTVRQQLAVDQKVREGSDVDLRAAIVQTMRNVRNAYWDFAFQIDNLAVQRQSLDLAKRLLADNEKRVQIGTMAPIDIVEAQAEVARNDESVIVAEAGIEQAQDRLRALIFDPSEPDFWSTTIEPTDTAPFEALIVDIDLAVRRALTERTDIQQSRNLLQRDDIGVRYLRNQVLPEVNANVTYGVVGVGGVRYQPINFNALPTGGASPPRIIQSEQSFASVLGDVFGNAFPTWTVGVQIGYPVGRSASEANLARARLQYSQAQTRLRELELQVATQVRDAGRQVQTNQKRVASARAARELAERRLEAVEKKFAAGIETSFFVFQAQRDLAQARTNEVRAISDHNKSLVDFEAVQAVPLR